MQKTETYSRNTNLRTLDMQQTKQTTDHNNKRKRKLFKLTKNTRQIEKIIILELYICLIYI